MGLMRRTREREKKDRSKKDDTIDLGSHLGLMAF